VHGPHSAHSLVLPVRPNGRNGRSAHAQGAWRGAVTTPGSRAHDTLTGGARSAVRALASSGRHVRKGGVAESLPTGRGSVKAKLQCSAAAVSHGGCAPVHLGGRRRVLQHRGGKGIVRGMPTRP
jgi:hypothetical protein